MCRVIRKHESTFHLDHLVCDIKLTNIEDVQASEEMLNILRKVLKANFVINERRIGPFETKPVAVAVSKIINGRSGQIRTYNKRGGKLPDIESFMKKHYKTLDEIAW
jgi:hypothetical protein